MLWPLKIDVVFLFHQSSNRETSFSFLSNVSFLVIGFVELTVLSVDVVVFVVVVAVAGFARSFFLRIWAQVSTESGLSPFSLVRSWTVTLIYKKIECYATDFLVSFVNFSYNPLWWNYFLLSPALHYCTHLPARV